MFKNSPFICYIFFAIDGIILWRQLIPIRRWWELALKISTWSNLCQKIINMEQSDCLNIFKQKLESWWTESADQKNW